MQINKSLMQKPADEIPLPRLLQHHVEKMVQKNSPSLQYLLTNKQLMPEALEQLYLVKMRELKTMSDIRNAVELNSCDLLSQLHMACYKAEDFLSAVINQALSLLRIPYTDISLKCDNCNAVILDARRTSMIIYNLISNALIHSKASEKIIDISATMRGSDFVISVTDNGMGIPAGKIKHLFSAFADIAAIENLSADVLTLNGMGLAVSRKAAREMNGDLVYVNTKKNTTFEIILPQHSQAVLNEPVEFIPDFDFVALHLATANLFYLERN